MGLPFTPSTKQIMEHLVPDGQVFADTVMNGPLGHVDVGRFSPNTEGRRASNSERISGNGIPVDAPNLAT